MELRGWSSRLDLGPDPGSKPISFCLPSSVPVLFFLLAKRALHRLQLPRLQARPSNQRTVDTQPYHKIFTQARHGSSAFQK